MYEKNMNCLLRQLGVNNSYKGFHYTIYSVNRAIQDPYLLTYISKGLYIETAKYFNTTISCVERDIRTIITIIWNHGDRELLNQIFQRKLEKKPQNGPFIDALAHYIESTFQS